MTALAEYVEEDASPNLPLVTPEVLSITLETEHTKLTVSVVGVLLQGNSLVYLNVVGAAQAVKALWATLVQSGSRYGHALYMSNRSVVVAPTDTTLKKISVVLPSGLTNMVIVDANATIITKGDPFYIIRTDSAFMDYSVPPEGFYDMLNATLRLPLSRKWIDDLWLKGQEKHKPATYEVDGPIRKLTAFGACCGVAVYTQGQTDRWKDLIIEVAGGE